MQKQNCIELKMLAYIFTFLNQHWETACQRTSSSLTQSYILDSGRAQGPKSLLTDSVFDSVSVPPELTAEGGWSLSGLTAVKHGPSNGADDGPLWLRHAGYWRGGRGSGCGKGKLNFTQNISRPQCSLFKLVVCLALSKPCHEEQAITQIAHTHVYSFIHDI